MKRRNRLKKRFGSQSAFVRRASTEVYSFELLDQRKLLVGTPQLLDLTSVGLPVPNLGDVGAINNYVFFSGSSSPLGHELWKTDGTAAGTSLVKDIFAGIAGSVPKYLVNVNGTLFFTARVSEEGPRQLWKSNGATSGTVRVATTDGSTFSDPKQLTNVNGVLFFDAQTIAANGASLGRELWKSDGSDNGTVLLKDIRPGSGSSEIGKMINANGTLFFIANNGTDGFELWRSNGAASGTTFVADINPGSADAKINRTPENVNGVLFFPANNGSNGTELWRSDGTVSGTFLVKDLKNNGAGNSYPDDLTNVNGLLFVTSYDNAGKTTLWRSDGTAEGTTLFKTLEQGSIRETVNANGSLFFLASTGGSDGLNLWKSDLTSSGTQIVKIFDAAPDNYNFFLENVNGTLYFSAKDESLKNEIYKSDGTSSGTQVITNFPGSQTPDIQDFSNVNGRIFFSAYSDAVFNVFSREFWIMDGGGESSVATPGVQGRAVVGPGFNLSYVKGPAIKPPGVSGVGVAPPTQPDELQLIDVVSGVGASSPQNFTNVSGVVYFTAQEFLGRFLWKTNGTVAGTARVDTGTTFVSSPQNLTNVNGRLYFTADFTFQGLSLPNELGMISNNGKAIILKDVRTGPDPSAPANLTNVGGILYFTANDGVHGIELWRSKGTAATTVLVKDTNPGTVLGMPLNGTPENLTNVHGVLYFSALGPSGRELWASYGYETYTFVAKEIVPGTGGGNPKNLVNIGGTLYFTADDLTHGRELWKTTGVSSAELVSDIRPGSTGSNPSLLTNVRGNLFFSADDGATGRELWAVLGESAAAIQPKNINPGSASSSPESLRNLNGTLVFTANNGTNGRELWRSNGIASGTSIVKDLFPGSVGSDPQQLALFGGKVYFSADDGIHGRELFSSLYGSSSLELVADIRPGIAGSNPQFLTRGDATWLAFSADDGLAGRELWILKNSTTSNLSIVPFENLAKDVEPETARLRSRSRLGLLTAPERLPLAPLPFHHQVQANEFEENLADRSGGLHQLETDTFPMAFWESFAEFEFDSV